MLRSSARESLSSVPVFHPDESRTRYWQTIEKLNVHPSRRPTHKAQNIEALLRSLTRQITSNQLHQTEVYLKMRFGSWVEEAKRVGKVDRDVSLSVHPSILREAQRELGIPAR